MTDKRPSWDEIRINQCVELARRSTCWKKKTASIITRNNQIIGEGYNGTSSGRPHCEDVGPRDRVEHRLWSSENETHGEINAILHALSGGCTIRDTTLYTLLSPCIKCAEAIYVIGITRVVYQIEGRKDGLAYLKDKGLRVDQIARAEVSISSASSSSGTAGARCSSCS